jgi:hypothetical protein
MLGPVVCRICHKELSSQPKLRLHIKKVHEKNRPFVCDYCDQRFGYRHHLVTHLLLKHENRRPYQCDFCDKTFAEKGKIKRHKLQQHGELLCDPRGDKTCLGCNTTPVWWKNGDDLCDNCDKIMTPNLVLEKLTTCQYCCRNCSEPVCDLCDNKMCHMCHKVLTTYSELKRHFMTIHEHLKPYSCQFCGRSFNQKCLVKIHVQKLHQNDASFAKTTTKESHVCNYCNRSFIEKYKFNFHMKTTHKDMGSSNQNVTIISKPKKLSKYVTYSKNDDFSKLITTFRCLACPYHSQDDFLMLKHHLSQHTIPES